MGEASALSQSLFASCHHKEGETIRGNWGGATRTVNWIIGEIAGSGSESRMMDWAEVQMVDCRNTLSIKRYERALADTLLSDTSFVNCEDHASRRVTVDGLHVISSLDKDLLLLMA